MNIRFQVMVPDGDLHDPQGIFTTLDEAISTTETQKEGTWIDVQHEDEDGNWTYLDHLELADAKIYGSHVQYLNQLEGNKSALISEAENLPLTRQQARHLIDTYCGDAVPDEDAAMRRLMAGATVRDLSRLADGESGAQDKLDALIYGDLK